MEPRTSSLESRHLPLPSGPQTSREPADPSLPTRATHASGSGPPRPVLQQTGRSNAVPPLVQGGQPHVGNDNLHVRPSQTMAPRCKQQLSATESTQSKVSYPISTLTLRQENFTRTTPNMKGDPTLFKQGPQSKYPVSTLKPQQGNLTHTTPNMQGDPTLFKQGPQSKYLVSTLKPQQGNLTHTIPNMQGDPILFKQGPQSKYPVSTLKSQQGNLTHTPNMQGDPTSLHQLETATQARANFQRQPDVCRGSLQSSNLTRDLTKADPRTPYILSDTMRNVCVRVPRRVVIEDTYDKEYTVEEKVIVEDFVEEEVPVQERVVEIGKQIVRETVVEIPEYEYVERVIEVPCPRGREVSLSTIPEETAEAGARQFRVPVIKTVRVPQHVERPVQEVVRVEEMTEVDRFIPVPVEEVSELSLQMPQLRGKWVQVDVPLYFPRIVEVAVPTDLLDDDMHQQCDRMAAKVNRFVAESLDTMKLVNSSTKTDLLIAGMPEPDTHDGTTGMDSVVMHCDLFSQLSTVDSLVDKVKECYENAKFVSQAKGCQNLMKWVRDQLSMQTPLQRRVPNREAREQCNHHPESTCFGI
ncbi:MAG: hypothetical protein KVP17_002520 [Porospora cf. gigantea B]|uniref:uncharacterized protein n=1 Tax=Porospora cf. gigantea B TaxID=2853592 RepID=UPI003571CFCC|nr:MAG: hypothetical protein KVP17_002520 [Porospora cf. gigantea B]